MTDGQTDNLIPIHTPTHLQLCYRVGLGVGWGVRGKEGIIIIRFCRPLEVDDEVVGVPPHCHGLLGTLVATAAWTVPGVVLIQHFTEREDKFQHCVVAVL